MKAASATGDSGGVPLSAALKAGRLPLDEVLAVGSQVAGALAQLHVRGIVHRGLRPDAILYDAADRRAWLADRTDAGIGVPPLAAALSAGESTGRLVYVSPEQTGRIDRPVDARSDLYALGIVLYEALLGAPPFRSDDALEQIHWHLAGVARSPSEIDGAIPAIVGDLVLKLLSKAPEERYQSARAAAHDLSDCERDCAAGRRIEPFPLGRSDLGETLRISSKLYGREREVHLLLEAFEQTCRGQGVGRMVLVEGYSGIGKTALIQQMYRPIVRQKGYFISGKFDQVARGVPFGALIQAFRGLVRQLLTEGESQLAAWREAISRSLGGNGGVLVAVIPELEFIVGRQPVPIELGSIEAQNRFQLVLQNFLAALATPKHPLVIFLDDLQWADAATLGLLAPLLSSPDIDGMMLMGAYRDHELDASPRLAHALAALSARGVQLTRVSLGPLLLNDLTGLVADTLRCSADEAAPLAGLVHEKTGGNPFFVIQFLKALERDGHLRFDAGSSAWAYEIDRIAALPLASNVIELMTRRIERLPSKSQYALTLAACIGNRFDTRTLAIVIEQTALATTADLQPALAEGLIIRVARAAGERSQGAGEAADGYAFLHDRVQQSAYALIPAERRRMVHLTVGRLLRARATQEEMGFAVFDVVHHLNLGRGLVHDAAERRDLAALNLAAGRRAKSSTAHDTALELFCAGVDLIDEGDWASGDPVCFELHLDAAESRYFCGQFDQSLGSLDQLAARARSPIELARVARLRSVQYENLARYEDALASAREGLAQLGVSFPDAQADKEAALELEIERIEALRQGRPIDSLVELSTMADPQIRMVMVILTDIWSATYILGDATLARLISATMVRLSLSYGNTEESAYGYVTHAITVGADRGEFLAAYDFGRLALAVNRRFDDSRRRAKIYQQFHAHVNFWRQPFSTCLPYAREACRAGLQSGDFLYAAYGAGTEPWAAIVATQDLARFVLDYSPNVALIEKLKNTGFADSLRLILNWARALQGLTVEPLSLTEPTLNEQAYLQAYRNNPFFAGIHAVARLHLCALFGDAEQALQAGRHASALVVHMPGTVWPLICEFWHALALTGAIGQAGDDERDDWLARVKASQAAYEARAGHCEENFRSQALLLSAEIARVEGREREAADLYEQAIEFTTVRPLIQFQALAHELCGRHLLQAGRPSLAALHLAQARKCYTAWGAHAKAAALPRQYPTIAWTGESPRPPAAAGATEPAQAQAVRPEAADGLDLFSVLKASQAIADEFDLPGLVLRLLHIVIECAGAERGALVLESDGGPIAYSGEPAGGAALEDSKAVPKGIVNFVRRTGEDVVLARADAEEPHGADPYVLRHRPRSVLCMPVQTQGRRIGVIYLEHRRVAGVFTPERVRTLRILATQAAISLECTRLFEGLTREIGERRRAQEELGAALAEVGRYRDALEAENTYLRRDLIANVSHDLRTPLASMRGYLELLSTKGESLPKEQQAQYLQIVLRQSERLTRLIDDLFELAKLDLKGTKPERELFSFGELATDVLQKYQPVAAEGGIELRLQTAPRLPFVHADVGLLERVLDNLIANAIHHTPSGGTVSVALSVDGDRVFTRVEDTGCGIAAAELPFLFDRFYRSADDVNRNFNGAGLGLAITKRILELHDTTISVESDEGAGTRFAFALPAHEASRPPA